MYFQIGMSDALRREIDSLILQVESLGKQIEDGIRGSRERANQLQLLIIKLQSELDQLILEQIQLHKENVERRRKQLNNSQKK